MAKNYSEIAFTDPVKAMQEKLGSRASYARMEKKIIIDGFTDHAKDFISKRDSFYIATTGENGYPYIQHRGGPKGFLKVLNPMRLGMIDFEGNAQYITVGNIVTNNKVSIIMVDYPSRTRLKIYAKAEIVMLNEDHELYRQLDLKDYKFRPQRMFVFEVEAYDWNCPQHITPRYTIEEINEAFTPQQKYISTLELEIVELKKQLSERK
jgi:uncharacterized protein